MSAGQPFLKRPAPGKRGTARNALCRRIGNAPVTGFAVYDFSYVRPADRPGPGRADSGRLGPGRVDDPEDAALRVLHKSHPARHHVEGGLRTLPPARTSASTVLSVSSTEKYVSQCEGPAGRGSSLFAKPCIPPTVRPSTDSAK